MTPFTCWDSEDNTPELIRAGKSPFEKVITQIAAIGCNGEEFHLVPPVTKWVVRNGAKTAVQDFSKFFAFLGKQPYPRAYAHNTGYDCHLWADHLDELDITLVGSRLIKARWRNTEFLDSFNIFPMSVKRIGDAVGLKKLKFGVNDREYAMRDVAIIRKGLQLAWNIGREQGVDMLPATLGGFCVKLWQAMGGTNWQCGMPLARAALYGGRTELFCKGAVAGPGETIYYTDINSLYPYVMTQPFPNDWYDLELTAKSFSGGGPKCFGVARVKIQIPESFIAPLPARRDDGAIMYPVGLLDGSDRCDSIDNRGEASRFNGVWTIHEIRNAVAHGARVLKVYESWGSEGAEYYYRDFVLHFYEQRKNETDSGKKLFYKLLMNNLYGQLGMSGEITRSVQLDSVVYKDATGKAILLDEQPVFKRDGYPYGTKFLTAIQFPLAEHVNWLHAAYITSYARLELQRYLRMIPEDKLIYCDTDSVLFRWPVNRPIPFSCGKELGEMKLVGKASAVMINAPKNYTVDFDEHEDNKTGRHYKSKGVPARYSENVQYLMDVHNCSAEELAKRSIITKKDARTLQQIFMEEGQVKLNQPYKLRESVVFFNEMKEGLKPVEKQRRLSVWREVIKTNISRYDKKKFAKNRYFPIALGKKI